MNWYIGQEVICIDSKGTTNDAGRHSGLKEGEIYSIQGLALSHCGDVVIDVGIPTDSPYYQCSCGVGNLKRVTVGWSFHERRFVPIANISELNKLLKEENITIKK